MPLEEFPEYLNTNESKSSPRRNEHNLKSPSSQLAHQISQIKLKSTTPKWEHSNITERNWGVQEKPSNQEKHEIHNDFEDEEEFGRYHFFHLVIVFKFSKNEKHICNLNEIKGI